MPDLQLALASLLDCELEIVRSNAGSGGCISDARCVRVRKHDSGETRELFVKSNDASFVENFQAESHGLKQLADANAIRVPSAIKVGVFERQAWLIMQWINEGHRPPDFFDRFAIGLAGLHRNTIGIETGLDHDNFLGSAPQPNGPIESWPEFFAERRLRFQIGWASNQGLADAELVEDVERIIVGLPELLEGRDDATSLLHGDLWSGNYLCDDRGDAVLIDPAVYRGCREAEFGMLKLFGGCPARFYEVYQDAFPMPGGWQRRVNVYVLYHLLNHLNLFGRGYHGQCSSLAAKILRT